jgi:LacI family transcriptional regulator
LEAPTGAAANGRAVTLRDVARLAGVSIATASKALNGQPQVRAATRARVIEAAERLSFSPNALAQGLITQRTGTVGLLTSDLEGRFSIPILMGAEDAFGSDQISVLLCDARGDSVRERHYLRTLLSRRVDGLIVVGARPDTRSSLGRDLQGTATSRFLGADRYEPRRERSTVPALRPGSPIVADLGDALMHSAFWTSAAR